MTSFLRLDHTEASYERLKLQWIKNKNLKTFSKPKWPVWDQKWQYFGPIFETGGVTGVFSLENLVSGTDF